MSNTTTYTNFSAIDYKGVDSLSSYALDLTPLLFIPELPITAHNRVVWDFGDGTTSRSFSASKSYGFPGRYSVNLVVYDCNNNAMISTFERIVEIYDYFPLTFNVSTYNESFTESGDISTATLGISVSANMEFKCGHISGPLVVNVYYPPYQTQSNIYYSSSGNRSSNYWEVVDNKFAHLENFHTLYSAIYNYSIPSYQFQEIERIEPSVENIYAKITNNTIVRCLSSDTDSHFIGMSGQQRVWFKDDSISNLILLKFWFDKTNNRISLTENPDIDYLNNLGITLSAKVVDNVPTKLSITSNGLDGEGYPITSFKINPIKYLDTKIPFVVKIKDVNNMSVKNFNSLPLSSLTITLYSIGDIVLSTEGGDILLDEYGNEIYATGISYPLSTSQYNIVSLNNTLSSQNFGGAFRGYVEFPSTALEGSFLQNIHIGVSGTVVNDQLSSYSLSGTSNVFNVYPQNYFDMYKVNEDFNPSQTLMDLRFQETLLDKNVLFEDFLGSLLGDSTYDHETIGVKIYEKISNFVSNTQDIDSCNREFIDSLAHIMGYNNHGEEQYQYPEKIKRIIDLASIGKHRLMGETNKFKENLDIKGRAAKDEYGINIGSPLNPATYIVNALTPIVALEKFSNTYIVLNTYDSTRRYLLPNSYYIYVQPNQNYTYLQPLSGYGSGSYPLSTYSSDWGWPLVLPDVFDFSDIGKYYLFFEYVDQTDDTVIGGMVDFVNSKTTVLPSSRNSDLFDSDGIFENMFSDTLYQSLSLVD